VFRIKICGITCIEDALAAGEAGADAIGLNFYPPSPRCVDDDLAEEIAAATPAGVAKVGLFVDAEAAEIDRRCDRLGLDWVQLHGDERPEYLAELAGRPVLKAFRCRTAGLDEVVAYLDRCGTLESLPAAVLLDAYQPGQYGGTGHRLDWPALAATKHVLRAMPLVLAGGLTADNVAEAVRIVGPHAVDTASGVELHPGRKDAAKVAAFCAAARAAFDDASDR